MPISDEVIELAPVKKTKKTLIILISVIGALFAAAVAFLIMYLLKPSVTEDKNHIKNISVDASELFADVVDGQEVLYASIGNEYTVYSTITVDNNSSANVSWEWPGDLIEMKGQKNDDGAYFKFVPRVGTNGKVVTIKARAAANVAISQNITFTIVNQGAEDLQVTSYGVAGNLTNVKDDNYKKELAITVPYYTMPQSNNNKPIKVNFNQLGRRNETTDEYSKLTEVTPEDGPLSGQLSSKVTVTSSNEEVITINEKTVTSSSFEFTASSIGSQAVEIRISANVYNNSENSDSDLDVITKVIKVTVKPNTDLGYVDSMYVFSKPVVDGAFIKSMLTEGNNALVSTQKINQIKDTTSKKFGRGIISSDDFEIVLPYNRSVGYTDIFKHIMINPATIQYNGSEIKDNWYKNIKVTSSNENILKTSTDTNGNVTLTPYNIAGVEAGKAACTLTFTDAQAGSAGASVTVPVRIVAQNTDIVMKVADNTDNVLADSTGKKLTEPMDVKAVTNGKYTVTMTYTFGMPSSVDNPQTLLESHCLNSKYKLDYVSDEIDVELKNSNIEKFEPNKEYAADAFKFDKKGGTSALTQWLATLTFTVTVKKNTDGKAKFGFIKNGSDLYSAESGTGLAACDKSFNIAVAFEITERASKAWIVNVADPKEETKMSDILDIVTDNGKYAGNFVRESDTKARLYVQNRSDEVLSMVLPENIKQFVRADKAHFNIANLQASSNVGFLWNKHVLTFLGESSLNGQSAATVSFNVTDAGGDKIASLLFEIYIIDAVTHITVSDEIKSVKYDSDDITKNNAFIQVASDDVKIQYRLNGKQQNYTKYTDVNLYYGKGMVFDGDNKVNSGDDYTFYDDETPLYTFNVKNGKLTALTDIYAYSYKKGIDFSHVELEFLLNDTDEWQGKHYDIPFNYDKRLSCEFTRLADDVALFKDIDYTEAISYDTAKHEFNDSVNQEDEPWVYVTAIVNIGKYEGDNDFLVYTERKSDAKAGLALVEKSYLTVPNDISIIKSLNADGASGGYYYVNYKAPTLQSDAEYVNKKFKVTYSGGVRDFNLTVTNAKRAVKKVTFFLVDPNDGSKKAIPDNLLTFGGFINGNVYSQQISVNVEYVAYEERHTQFEKVLLTFPEYLTVNGNKNSCTILPSTDIDTTDSYAYDCEIALAEETDAFAIGKIEAVLDGKQSVGAKASCNVEVCAGLKQITVKNGETTVSVNAGDSGKNTISHTFNLKNRSDVKSLVLDFEYTAINNGNYAIPFDYKSNKFTVSCPTNVSGLVIENDVKGITGSTLTVKIPGDPGKVAALNGEVITVTFTDTNNSTNKNNVFTLDIIITVTMDIYELAFAEGSDFTVTVTGESTGVQPALPISVKYNNGADGIAPTDETIQEQNVVGIYTYQNGKYEKVISSSDIYVTKSGAEYKLYVKNCINRSVKYYVGLAYSNVTPSNGKHYLPVTINTRTSHIEFAEDNVTLKEVEGSLVADVVVLDENNNTFRLAVDVVNDGSGAVESGKTVKYELYSDPAYSNKLTSSGVSIATNGLITVAPNMISDTVYYMATYTDDYNEVTYTKKAVFKYRVAPSAVAANITSSSLFDATNKVITLYYSDSATYTSIDLTGAIVTSNAFGVSYGAGVVQTNIALKNAADSAYATVSGLTVTPKSVNGNADTDVVIVISSTYADVTVKNEYTVRIIRVQAVSLSGSKDELSLLDNTDSVTITPTITNYAGLNYTYGLQSDTNGMLAISGTGDEKTVKLANGNTAQKNKAYKLTATLTYTLTESGVFKATKSFTSITQYSITVVGEYTPTFKLVKVENSTEVEIPAGSAYPIDGDAAGTTYRLVITGDDSMFTAEYTATYTNTVVKNISGFTSKKASITFNNDASGAFTITVNAVVGGTTYAHTQNYNFSYGIQAVGTLYLAANGAEFSSTAFTGDSHEIDYENDPYKFKYVVSGISSDATVNIVVNGDVEKTALQSDGNNKYIVITVKKPTTMCVGGSVKVGSRTIYLEDKTVTLTATKPDFVLTTTKDTLMPTEQITLGLTKATGFMGDFTVEYTTTSAYATIEEGSDKLVAVANVVDDQTVIVRATVNVSNGVYADEYILEKAVTVKGVKLPTIAWKDSAARAVKIGEYTYSTDDYTFNNNNATTLYNYNGKVTIEMLVGNTTLVSGTDYTFTPEGQLTVYETDRTRAGNSIDLTVKVKINSGANKGEQVSDTITVLILPIMNKENNTITLGNAVGTYDFNGAAYKSVFAPTGLTASDYGIISLSVDNLTDFGVDGANLIVKNNVTSSTTTVKVTATVLITGGTYKGATVSGEKTVSFTLPQSGLSETFNLSDGTFVYDSLTLDKAHTVGNSVSSAVKSITVSVPTAVADYVTVVNNGKASPTVHVAKEYGAYLTGTATDKEFTVSYVVAMNDGKVYYNEATYTVGVYKVTVSAANGEEAVAAGGTVTINSGDTAIMRLTANKGYDVTVVSASHATMYLTSSVGGNGVQFNAVDVNSNQDNISVTLAIKVAGIESTFAFKVSIQALQTGTQYTATNLDNIDFAVNRATGVAQNANVTSTWTASTYAYYTYGQYVTVTAPTGHNLDEYFTSLKLNTKSFIITGNSDTVYFNERLNHDTQTRTFTLDMKFNVSAAIPLSTIEVKYYGYNRGMGGSAYPITMQYRVQVINTVPVTLDYNAGSDSGNVTPITYSDPSYKNKYNLTNPSRTGYTFDGWYPQATGGTKVDNGAIVTNAQPHTLYAHWTAKTYTLKYEGYSDQSNVTYGLPYGKLITPEQDGKEFINWTYGDKVITADTLVLPVGNVTEITLTAQWRTIYYKVTLDANGGKVGDSSTLETQVAYNGKYNLHTVIVPTYAGHKFDGWYTQATGGDKVTTEQTITADKPLYAHWIAQYTVSFDLNYDDAPDAPESKTYINDEAYGTLPVVSRSGYKFDGWYTSGNAEVTSDQTVTASVTLYAHWTQLFTVTLDAGENGSIGGNRYYKTTVSKGDSYSVHLSITPTYAGHKFDGWYTQAEPDGDKVTTEQTITAELTLYAHWEDPFTVSFNLNYTPAPTAPASKTYYVNDTYGTLPVVSRSGYKFDGWYTSGNAEVTSDQTVTASVTLYAHWTQLFTVDFNLNYDGAPISGTFGEKTYADGDTYGSLPTVSRDGFSFDGWHTHPTNNSKVETTQTVTATITLYAHWTQTKFTVTLYANGGVFEGDKTVLTYYVDKNDVLSLADINIDPTDKLDGYVFDGWFLDGEKQSDEITVTTDIALIAQWKEAYVVTYCDTKNNEPIILQIVKYSEAGKYNEKEVFECLNNTGYGEGGDPQMMFVGWSLQNPIEESEVTCINGDEEVLPEGATLYAVYAEEQEDI